MTVPLTHLTLNTDGIAVSASEEVSTSVRSYLLPRLEEEAAILTHLLDDWGVHLAQLPGTGWAVFNIVSAADQDPVTAMGFLCWDERTAAAQCRLLLDTDEAFHPILERIDLWADPRPCSEVPWMAVLLTPSLTEMPSTALAQVSGIQRAIACTLIDPPVGTGIPSCPR